QATYGKRPRATKADKQHRTPKTPISLRILTIGVRRPGAGLLPEEDMKQPRDSSSPGEADCLAANIEGDRSDESIVFRGRIRRNKPIRDSDARMFPGCLWCVGAGKITVYSLVLRRVPPSDTVVDLNEVSPVLHCGVLSGGAGVYCPGPGETARSGAGTFLR